MGCAWAKGATMVEVSELLAVFQQPDTSTPDRGA